MKVFANDDWAYCSDSFLTLWWKCWQMKTQLLCTSASSSTSSRNLLATISRASDGHAYTHRSTSSTKCQGVSIGPRQKTHHTRRSQIKSLPEFASLPARCHEIGMADDTVQWQSQQLKHTRVLAKANTLADSCTSNFDNNSVAVHVLQKAHLVEYFAALRQIHRSSWPIRYCVENWTGHTKQPNTVTLRHMHTEN